jgi:hypothetical protein
MPAAHAEIMQQFGAGILCNYLPRLSDGIAITSDPRLVTIAKIESNHETMREREGVCVSVRERQRESQNGSGLPLDAYRLIVIYKNSAKELRL